MVSTLYTHIDGIQGILFTVISSDAVIACCKAYVEPEQLFLTSMYVDPSRRGEGHAKAILDVAKEAAQKLEKHLTLEVLPTNTSAINLYQRNGFVKYDEASNGNWHMHWDS